MTGILLYRCPKLSGTPRITESQCGRNHKRAAKAHSKPYIRNASSKNVAFRNPGTEDLIWFGPCVGCPGVKVIASQPGGEQPTLFERADRVAKKRKKTPWKKSTIRPSHKAGHLVAGNING